MGAPRFGGDGPRANGPKGKGGGSGGGGGGGGGEAVHDGAPQAWAPTGVVKMVSAGRPVAAAAQEPTPGEAASIVTRKEDGCWAPKGLEEVRAQLAAANGRGAPPEPPRPTSADGGGGRERGELRVGDNPRVLLAPPRSPRHSA
eukprot:scaffold8105_cov41-Phaeocystis_antarctica.AAC.3